MNLARYLNNKIPPNWSDITLGALALGAAELLHSQLPFSIGLIVIGVFLLVRGAAMRGTVRRILITIHSAIEGRHIPHTGKCWSIRADASTTTPTPPPIVKISWKIPILDIKEHGWLKKWDDEADIFLKRVYTGLVHRTGFVTATHARIHAPERR